MHKYVTTTRDCDALLIPSGMLFTIPEGTDVEITQALGTSVTVHINGQLARINGTDIDVLGLTAQELGLDNNLNINKKADGPVDTTQVWDKLKTVFDPEIPVNIVDLGLIYDINVNKNHVVVTMTLTAPGCGMGPILVQDVEMAVRCVNNVTDAIVEITFEPLWNQDMMTEEAKLQLGLL